MDGANMNAQVGLCRPGDIGADVCHLNLHKTFCIPHGGGGPGMGPIGVAKHLAPFLPGHPVVDLDAPAGLRHRLGRALGQRRDPADLLGLHRAHGLRRADRGDQDRDPQRQLHRPAARGPLRGALHRARTGWWRTSASSTPGRSRRRRASRWRTSPSGSSTTASIRRRSPSRWPGTLMIEPTESESKEELDRFCDAMIAIREEIREIEEGRADRENNLLTNAPHTLEQVIADGWDRPYPRERAAYPSPGGARAQGVADGGPDRQRLRRPQPGVHLPADGGVWRELAGRLLARPLRRPRPAGCNMAIDQALLAARRRGASGGSGSTAGPRTASRSADTSRPLRRYDRSGSRRSGLDVVRRPTGGRAVWHAERADLRRGGTGRGLRRAARGLRRDSPDAAGRAPHPRRAGRARACRAPPSGLDAGACFAAPAGGEVIVAPGASWSAAPSSERAPRCCSTARILLADDQAHRARMSPAASPPIGSRAGAWPTALGARPDPGGGGGGRGARRIDAVGRRLGARGGRRRAR